MIVVKNNPNRIAADDHDGARWLVGLLGRSDAVIVRAYYHGENPGRSSYDLFIPDAYADLIDKNLQDTLNYPIRNEETWGDTWHTIYGIRNG